MRDALASESSDAIEEWMHHSLRLARARYEQQFELAHAKGKEKPHAGRIYDPALLNRLHREVKIREFVLKHWRRGDLLDGSARVWWVYMLAHAKLQIRRDAGELGDTVFLTACAILRRERDAADRRVEHLLWMKPTKTA